VFFENSGRKKPAADSSMQPWDKPSEKLRESNRVRLVNKDYAYNNAMLRIIEF